MKEKNYRPVSCAFYDELTLLSMRRKNTYIEFASGSGAIEKVLAIISDIYTSEKAEYLLLDTGLSIRIDKIQSIDGKNINGFL
jgi:Rho-binding antiterminator